MHEVLRALTSRVQDGTQAGARDDGLRVALAIEGGGMRGTISAGMAFALHELGLVPAFDAARRDPLTWPDGRVPARSLRLISRTTLRRESAALRATFLGRGKG